MRKRGEKETKRESERKSVATERERRSGRERGRRRERRSEKESGTANVKEQRRKSERKREAAIVAKTEADQGVYKDFSQSKNFLTKIYRDSSSKNMKQVKFCSSVTHFILFPNMFELFSSFEHQIRYSDECWLPDS